MFAPSRNGNTQNTLYNNAHKHLQKSTNLMQKLNGRLQNTLPLVRLCGMQCFLFLQQFKPFLR